MLERILRAEDNLMKIVDRKILEQRVEQSGWHENDKMGMDPLCLCFVPVAGTTIFGDPLILFEEMGEIFQAVTGASPENLFEAAERACQDGKGL